MIDVFYESFTDEMRAMLLTDEYDKALIYVSMPYVNIDDTAILVNEIDEIAYVRDKQMHFQDAQMSQLTGGPPVTIAIFILADLKKSTIEKAETFINSSVFLLTTVRLLISP